jgi:hypothetical protein
VHQFVPLAKHEAAARQELEDVVPRLEDLALERLAAAHDVPHALLGLTRNADRRQLAGAIEACEVLRIALVVFPLYAWPFRDQRRRDDVTRVAPLSERPMQHVASAACFVADAELAVLGQAIDEALEFGEVVREPLNAGGHFRGGRQDRDGDGLLVHVHPEIDD